MSCLHNHEDLLEKSILVQLDGPMRDTIMKLKTLKRILKTYLSNHCEMCKGTLGFSFEKHVSSEIYIHPFIKTVVIRTDHTMAKGKVMIYKTLHRKLKIE